MPTFKVTVNDQTVRLVSSKDDLIALRQKIKSRFPSLDRFSLGWIDEDNDFITIASSQDLSIACDEAGGSAVKLTVNTSALSTSDLSSSQAPIETPKHEPESEPQPEPQPEPQSEQQAFTQERDFHELQAEELVSQFAQMARPFGIEVDARFEPGSSHHIPASLPTSPERHEGVICDVCENGIVGTRFKCAICPDYDLCSNCEQEGHHSEHVMLRLRKPSPYGFRMLPSLERMTRRINHIYERHTSHPRRHGRGRGRGRGRCGWRRACHIPPETETENRDPESENLRQSYPPVEDHDIFPKDVEQEISSSISPPNPIQDSAPSAPEENRQDGEAEDTNISTEEFTAPPEQPSTWPHHSHPSYPTSGPYGPYYQHLQHPVAPYTHPFPQPIHSHPRPPSQPQVPPQPVPPQPQVQARPRFNDQISQLRSMGVELPPQTLEELLVQHNGDVSAVVAEIFGN